MADLKYTVYLTADDGSTKAFGPGNTVPDWARKRITNPNAWEDDPDDDLDDVAPPAVVAAQAAGLRYPDGDPDGEWKFDELVAYAADHNVDIDGLRSKADVRAAIEAAAGA